MFRKILLATDFSPIAERAEDETLALAHAFGAQVIALHAIEPIETDDESMFADFYVQLTRAAEHKLAALRARFEARGVTCKPEIRVERRWQAIVDTARSRGAELIVLGSHAPRMAAPGLGTTSHKVFLSAPVPVLFVRLPAAEERAAEAASAS
jgi:nucleotide-binding universal stress UspA family protein